MPFSRRVLPLLFLYAGLLAAPPRVRADDKDETAERARAVLRTYCQKCHAGPDDQVKAGLQVFDPKLLLKRKVVRQNDPDRSELFQLVACGSMPPGDLPKPGPEDVDTLREWIADGARDFPAEYGDAFVLRKIQKDLVTLNAKDQPYQRYFSFNHLLADDAGAPDSALWRDALLKALNHLSLQPEPVPVTPIDPAQSIFRVDERRLGWELQPFEAKDPKEPTAAPNASHVDLFDLILLEYPFATLPSRFAGEQKPLAEFMRKADPLRPILYVRGDWFVSTATQSPLYEDLLRLPRLLTGPDGLEGKIAAAPAPARAGFLDSHKSRLPQLVERRASSAGAYWRTFDLGSANDMKGLLTEAAAADLAERGGLMLFGLPNGLNGYYIAENVAFDNNKRLARLAAAAPKEWVSDPAAADQVARNGLSCMRCHESGAPSFTDAAGAAVNDLPAADKAKLAPLFPGKEAMDKLLAEDQGRFLNAVKAVHGRPLDREPLTPVTRRFLLGGKPGPIVPASLNGAAETEVEPAVAFGDRRGNLLARIPGKDPDAPALPPLDGLTMPDYQPPLSPVDVTFKALNFKTGKETTTFLPGDQLALEVTNQGANDATIELIAYFMDGGLMQVDQAPLLLKAGTTYHYPQDRPVDDPKKKKQFLKMGLPPGVDRYILFAADRDFPEGVRLHSAKDKNIIDRVVHPFWVVVENGTESRVDFDPTHLIKKTLFIETREK